MAKRKTKSKSLLLTVIALLCGVLVIVGVIVPFLVSTRVVIGTTTGSTSIGGFDLMNALFSGDDALTSENVSVMYAWRLMNNDTVGAATKTLAVSALVGFIAAALGVVAGVLKLVLKKAKLCALGMKACFALCFVFSVIGMICGFVIAGNTGVDLGIAKVTNAVGVGVYLALVGALGATAASVLEK